MSRGSISSKTFCIVDISNFRCFPSLRENRLKRKELHLPQLRVVIGAVLPGVTAERQTLDRDQQSQRVMAVTVRDGVGTGPHR